MQVDTRKPSLPWLMCAGCLVIGPVQAGLPAISGESDSGELPDEALLMFLAEAVEIEGEWVDPLAYQERLLQGTKDLSATSDGGDDDEE